MMKEAHQQMSSPSPSKQPYVYIEATVPSFHCPISHIRTLALRKPPPLTPPSPCSQPLHAHRDTTSAGPGDRATPAAPPPGLGRTSQRAAPLPLLACACLKLEPPPPPTWSSATAPPATTVAVCQDLGQRVDCALLVVEDRIWSDFFAFFFC
jgi:hypothetical protein